MGERTHGLHRLVTFSGLYLTIQRLLAGPNAHQRVADFVFGGLQGKSVLEIGCGPGTWYPYLGATANYVGIDWNANHIDAANRQYASPTARFVCADLGDPQFRDSIGPFDVVIGMGILHHLDDPVVDGVAANLATLLGPQGRYIGVEPVLHDRQNPVARFLKAIDSGKNIRRETGYRSLLSSHFDHVDTRIRTDMMRVPYSHCFLSASGPTLRDAAPDGKGN